MAWFSFTQFGLVFLYQIWLHFPLPNLAWFSFTKFGWILLYQIGLGFTLQNLASFSCTKFGLVFLYQICFGFSFITKFDLIFLYQIGLVFLCIIWLDFPLSNCFWFSFTKLARFSFNKFGLVFLFTKKNLAWCMIFSHSLN